MSYLNYNIHNFKNSGSILFIRLIGLRSQMRVKRRLRDERFVIFICVSGPCEELQILEGPGLNGTGPDLLPPVWFIAECAIFSVKRESINDLQHNFALIL